MERRRARIYSFRIKLFHLSLVNLIILVLNFNFISVNSSNSNNRFGSLSSSDSLKSDYIQGGSRIRTSFKVDSSSTTEGSKAPVSPRSISSLTYPSPYKQSHTYKISSKPCNINSNNDNEILRGTCMFVWECIKSEGKHLGMCIDGFMFGSCCSHNDTHNVIVPETDNSMKTSTNLPFVTSNNSVFTTSTISSTSSQLPWVTTPTSSLDFFTGAETDTTEFFTETVPTTTTSTTTTTTSSTAAPTTVTPSFVTFTDYIPDIPSTTPSKTTTTTTTTETPVPTVLETESPTSTKRPDSQNDECGIAPLVPQKRIVGGKQAGFGTWPWIVSVRRTSFFGFSSTHRCGGTLINENWVITAGHCVDDLLISQIRIRIGEWDFSVKGGDGTGDSGSGSDEKYQHIERGVLRKVVHGSYNFFTYENDLALLYLDGGSINYSQHIRPLCLQGNQDLLVGYNATVAGWGRLSEGGILPNRLQQVTVPIMSNEECRKLFLKSGRVEHIPDIFLCAGYPNGGRDSCQGDSGGPLQVKGENGRWFLAGIISWGIGCAEPNMPGVCTRISKFTEWILKHVT